MELRVYAALAAPEFDSRAIRRGWNVLKTFASLVRARTLRQNLATVAGKNGFKDELGLNFIVCGADRWHDYREADCVVAMRGFGRSAYLHKPGTKLYNAWLAGVPFIGGMDSAYAADGKPGRDFLQVSKRDELFAHLRQLRERPELRQQLVAAGRAAASNFSFQATLARWQRLLGDTVPELGSPLAT